MIMHKKLAKGLQQLACTHQRRRATQAIPHRTAQDIEL
jgi:hypothetical protein